MTLCVFATTILMATAVPGYAMGWGALSLINAGLAQSKNHSGMLWWLISLLLGPIATLIIVVALDKSDRPMMKGYDDFR